MAGNREIYAVEVSLVQGGDLHPVDADEKASSFRPVFSKLALHNDWPDWPVQTAEEQSEAHHRHRAFFQPIIGKLRRSRVTDRVDALARNDHGFPSGLPGISYHIGFWGGIAKPSLDVHLWIATDDKDRNKEIFDVLHQRRGQIEAELAGVSWDRRNNQRMCSIYFTESGSIADAEERLVELRDWAPDRLIALKTAFQPRLEEVMRDLGDDYRAIRQQASGDGDEGSASMKLTELIERAPWREAITYRHTWPHEYVLLQKDHQRELLEAVCERFRNGEGVPSRFFAMNNVYLFIGDYKYWLMAPPDEVDWDDEAVLNRARLYRDRRDFIIQDGDSGMPAQYPSGPAHSP